MLSKSQTKELEALAYDKVCIVIYCAIKLLPTFYREKIEQWFEKGGVPWYEVVVFKILESEAIKKHYFTHVAQQK